MKNISISGEIGWDVRPESIKSELDAAAGGPVNFIISSPGGYVSDALEIFNLIRNYSGETKATLSGFAMSAASYIPLACDNIVAEDNAVYMIHNVRGGVWGDHNEIIHYGEMCSGLSMMIARAYASYTGKELAEITAMMDDETYFFGIEIVDAGFASEIVTTENDKDSQTAFAMARLALENVCSKMNANQSASKQDLNRAAALAHGKYKRAVTPTNIKKEDTMDLAKLKSDYPDLVAAIASEATSALDGELSSARDQGAINERKRIQSVLAQSMPGHEALIEKLAFDGKTTGPEAAVQILAAEKKIRENAKEDLKEDGIDPVDNAPPAEPKPKDPTEETFESFADLKEEFGDWETYKAYKDAEDAGQVKTLKKGSK